MGYDVALSKSWSELEEVTKEKRLSVNFLSDEYSVDLDSRLILSLSCNIPAKEYLCIIILHYLAKKNKGLPYISGEWIDFRQLDGGQGYYPSFRERVIETINRKYGSNPDGLSSVLDRFKAKDIQVADASVVLDVFEGVPVLVEIWKGDDEFGPEANILFDKSIKDVFCTEDIVVLSEFIAHKI
jgi:hypothetical protein